MPFKNKVIRNYVFVLIAACGLLLSAFLTGCDREDMLYNTWNLSSVLMNGEPLNDSLQFNVIPKYTYYTFFYVNVLEISTVALGSVAKTSDGYYAFIDHSTLLMEFTLLYEHYKIEAKIKKITRRELNLEYKDSAGNTYFLIFFSRT
jgi:hypothetical protein